MSTAAAGGLTVVAGAGGFIGGHLVAELLRRGQGPVRAVDVKPLEEWHQSFAAAESLVLDLRDRAATRAAVAGASDVFNLACDMGGMGFIELNKAACMASVLINTQLLLDSVEAGVRRYLFASSACVYNLDRQSEPGHAGLREEDAYPAQPEDGYGWEKLFGERMCRHMQEDHGLEVRIPRFHNVYGPHGTWHGGREKAPAAVCRKVAAGELFGIEELSVWGDGRQTRSFMFIDDCIDGMLRLFGSDVSEPLNVGSSQTVSIDGLADIVEGIAGVRLRRVYDTSAPQGVRGRNSDNTRIRALLGWEPETTLEQGLAATYAWVRGELARSGPGVL